MSAESLRLAREGYQAWNRHDLDRLLETIAEDWEFEVRARIPGMKPVYRGKQGLRELFTEWYTEPWEGGLEMKVKDLIELDDDRVLGLITFHGTGKHSGIEVTQPYAHLLEFKDGLNVRTEGFTTWERALAFCGLDHALADRQESPVRDGS